VSARDSCLVFVLIGALSALSGSACDTPMHNTRTRTARGVPRRTASLATAAPPGSMATPRPISTEPHPVMAAYRAGLTELFGDESVVLEEVSLEGTQHGDAERLRYMAADRVVRVLLPLALEAQHDVVLNEHARRLRALPPILNRDVDLAVLPIVRDAMRALRRVEAGFSADRAPIRGLPSSGDSSAGAEVRPVLAPDDEAVAFDYAAADVVDPAAEAVYADALAEYAEAYAQRHGVGDLRADAAAAAAADALAAGSMFAYAVERYGVSREDALREASSLYADMAGAARRRERVPRPSTPPPAPAPTDGSAAP
jgi:hypothetical protein